MAAGDLRFGCPFCRGIVETKDDGPKKGFRVYHTNPTCTQFADLPALDFLKACDAALKPTPNTEPH